ncbi:hypothetical protein TNCV_1389201 [Trichonephila clavipes]|nr:hypothetical protein TNCV_1389201 [Trichonephila clavipes]
MRLRTLQAIWQRCVIVLDRVRVSVPCHSAVRVSTPSVNYAIFVTVVSKVVFELWVTQNGTAEFGATLCHTILCSELASVTFEKLKHAYEGHSLSRAQVFLWHKSCLRSRKHVEDEHRSGRHSLRKPMKTSNV